jgi:fumarate reductase flavoprotein subunit
LTELLVFGKRAALSALEHIESGDQAPNDAAATKQAERVQNRIRGLFEKSSGTESISGLRKEMTDIMEAHVGIYRTAEGLESACAKIGELRQRYEGIALHDKSNVYNTDLLQALELGAMLDCAEAVAVGALERKESRGAHQRLDFEARDDQNYLKHTMAHYHPKEPPRIDYHDVVITKSQPSVRDYSGAKK